MLPLSWKEGASCQVSSLQRVTRQTMSENDKIRMYSFDKIKMYK